STAAMFPRKTDQPLTLPRRSAILIPNSPSRIFRSSAMLTSLVLGAALAAPGAPIPQDTDPAPTSPAPWVLYLKTDDASRAQVMVYKNQKVAQNRQVTETVDGKVVTKVIQEQVERIVATYVQLENVNPKFTTVQGTTLTSAAVLKRAKDGLVVLVSADGKAVSK